MGFARTPIVLFLLFGACVRSQATRCGDLLCPEGSICAKGSVCVSGALATACGGRTDGATCTLSELGNGTCQMGLCIIGRCGDGIVNGIEACDGANLGGKTCVDFGSTDMAGLTCTPDCSFDKSGCNGYCGDGHKGQQRMIQFQPSGRAEDVQRNAQQRLAPDLEVLRIHWLQHTLYREITHA